MASSLRRNTGADWTFWPVAVALIGASVIYCLPLFTNLENWGRQDWDQFTFRYATPRVALLRDHVLPTWNPYASGGNVLLAHPDSPVLSPWYLLVLILGAPIGLRVQVLVFMALGAVGMAAFARRLGISSFGAMASGIVFMMSSHFALHVAEGHLEWCVLGLMPWLALCISYQTWRSTIAAALLLASVMTFGSVYVPAIYLPFFTMWQWLESLRHRNLGILGRWLAAVLIALVIASPKLLPVISFTSEHPRDPILGVDAPLSLWPTMFGDPRQVKFYWAYRDRELEDGHFAKRLTEEQASPFLQPLESARLIFSFHEFGCYIGAVGILMALLGIARTARQTWSLGAAGVLAAVFVLGHNAPVDLWSALREFPLYEQLRVPSRFLMAVVFVLSIASGFGMSTLLDACRGSLVRWRRRIGSVLVLALYVELAVLGWTLFSDVFVVPPVAVPAQGDFRQGCGPRPLQVTNR